KSTSTRSPSFTSAPAPRPWSSTRWPVGCARSPELRRSTRPPSTRSCKPPKTTPERGSARPLLIPPSTSSENWFSFGNGSMELARFHEHAGRLKAGLRRVFFGQDDVLDQLLAALYAGGHVLLEGVPGLGKTLLAKSLARLFEADFQRIQFTPDLMPADILGTE